MPILKILAKLFCSSVFIVVFPSVCAAGSSDDGSFARLEIISPHAEIDCASSFRYVVSYPYDSMRSDVEALSSPLFEGRKTGSASSLLLSMWVEKRFEKSGIEPFSGRKVLSFETPDGRKGHNVMGCIEGASGKWIVVMAYYDGLGTSEEGHYPGADSNASGVAVMAGLADMLNAKFKASGTIPKDGILFLALDGHHDKYAGAHAFLREVDISKIKLVVNIDMIGSSLAPVHKRRPHYLIALGGERFRVSLDRCSKVGRQEMYYDYYSSDVFTDMFYRRMGDHAEFLRCGIMSVAFTSGVTLNTNKLSDTPSSLDYNALHSRLLVIYRWLLMLCSV